MTENAKRLDLFKSFPNSFKFFQWHGDTFDMPEGAVHIAESAAVKNQAFIYNDKTVALQFHPEMTESSIKDLINNCRSELVESEYIQSEQEILNNVNLTEKNNNIMIELLNKMEDKWFKKNG